MYQTIRRCCFKQSVYLFVFSVVLTVFNKTRTCEVADETGKPVSGDSGHFSYNLKSQEHHLSVNATSSVMSRKLFKYMSYHLKNSPYPGVSIYTSYTIARLEIRPKFELTPLVPHIIPVINDITSFKYPIDLPLCRTAPKAGERTLFVGVISAPNNFEKRKVIRETWRQSFETRLNILNAGSIPIAVVNFAFITGRSVDHETNRKINVESAQFGDILQVEMLDTYYNITIKVTGLLNWLNCKCGSVDFVLKVDDDVFVNTRNLGAFIRQVNPLDFNAYGEAADGKVGRVGKWKLSIAEYPWSTFPKYLQGGAILLSGSTVRYLLAAAQAIPYHSIDDLYLTGFSAEKAGISLMTSHSFFERFYDEAPKECDVMFSITWLVDSVDRLKLANNVTETFYKNNSRCVLPGSLTALDQTKSIHFNVKKYN